MYGDIYGNNGFYYPRYQQYQYFQVNGIPDYFNNSDNGQYNYQNNNGNMSQRYNNNLNNSNNPNMYQRQQNINNNYNMYQQNVNNRPYSSRQNNFQQNINNSQNSQNSYRQNMNSQNMYGGNNINNNGPNMNKYPNNSNSRQNAMNIYQNNSNNGQNVMNMYQNNSNNRNNAVNMYQNNSNNNQNNLYNNQNRNNQKIQNEYQNKGFSQGVVNNYNNNGQMNQNNIRNIRENGIENGIANNQQNQNVNQNQINNQNQIKQNGKEENNDNGSNINNENGKPKNEEKKEKTNEELMLEYEYNIRKEVEKTTPLISEDFPISKLVEEYKANEEYSKIVQNIAKKYKYIRKVRRDGNCFYRSFIFRLFEHICIKHNEELFKKIKQKIMESKELMERNGYEWIIVEDFYNLFLKVFNDCFNSLSYESYQYTVRDYLDTLFTERERVDYLIYFIRFCIAAYLKENKELYQAYIEGDINEWVSREVEAINQMADQIQIMACVNYFDIGVKIEYLNKSSSEIVKLPHDKPDNEFFIFLLYTPGHYDILYP